MHIKKYAVLAARFCEAQDDKHAIVQVLRWHLPTLVCTVARVSLLC